uniref:Exopolygalacturonase n=1 Tax=Lilium longiflorum TaxID=4690 RepID=Q2M4X6_LILLO|nr:polygalacturonase [Lilium longiflorum]AAZ91659.1 polygalacturonase [Lilium longiflorum]
MASISSARLLLLSSVLLIVKLTAGLVPETKVNVKSFGAVGDGKTDSTQAILRAWDQACNGFGKQRVIVPEGVYLTGPMAFRGPCNGFISMQVRGELRAYGDVGKYPNAKWVSYEDLNGLLVTGGGRFNAQGSQAWTQNDCSTKKNCALLTTSVKFDHCTNATIRRINSIDSKFFHIAIDQCTDITVHHINITAPGTSPNTDGIHIGRSTNVNISNAIIGTGDDCISLGPGSSHITISKVQCGPGHGISVGSLGRYMNEENVWDVKVKNCTLTGTTNGVRIKTWKGSSPSEASQFIFQDIEMREVQNPIIIDQEYCSYDYCANNPPAPSKVKLSDIQFMNIKGTSTSKVAINLICSSAVPCEGIQLSDISLKYIRAGKPTMANCSHVSGTTSGLVSPPSCIKGADVSLFTTQML